MIYTTFIILAFVLPAALLGGFFITRRVLLKWGPLPRIKKYILSYALLVISSYALQIILSPIATGFSSLISSGSSSWEDVGSLLILGIVAGPFISLGSLVLFLILGYLAAKNLPESMVKEQKTSLPFILVVVGAALILVFGVLL